MFILFSVEIIVLVVIELFLDCFLLPQQWFHSRFSEIGFWFDLIWFDYVNFMNFSLTKIRSQMFVIQRENSNKNTIKMYTHQKQI